MKKLILSFGFWILGFSLSFAAPPFAGNTKAPIEINADSLEVLQNQKMAIFSGNVVAKQSDMTLKANKMTVHYAGETTNNSISKIDVDGNVLLATPRETARGNSGNYDVKNDFITLSGNVVLTKDKNVLKGTRLDYDIKNGQSKIIGVTGTNSRVQALFVPEEKKQ